jgi:hypothetical protein
MLTLALTLNITFVIASSVTLVPASSDILFQIKKIIKNNNNNKLWQQ